MVQETVVFQCEDALQMKAVAMLIQKASSFKSTIYLTRDGRRANAKSLLGVMSLGIENGVGIDINAFLDYDGINQVSGGGKLRIKEKGRYITNK